MRMAGICCGLLAAAAVPIGAQVITGETARRSTRLFPALGYGPHAWSILRLTNQSESPKQVEVHAYRQNGDRLPVGPDFVVRPRERLDVRIEAKAEKDELAWATVAEAAGSDTLAIRASIEVLEGDRILDFERQEYEPSTSDSWSLPSSEVPGGWVYFLNASETETTIRFCGVIVARKRACNENDAARGSFEMEARHSVVFHVETPRLKYLMVESSRPSGAVILLLRPAAGRGRTFSTESSIRFEDIGK
jgi:hypothetical protein